MTVSKYGKGLWKIDVSDGYDELTGERKRIVKLVSLLKSKPRNMKLTSNFLNYVN